MAENDIYNSEQGYSCYLKCLKDEYLKPPKSKDKHKFKDIKLKYSYLNSGLKLINNDFFKNKPELE